MVFWFRFVTLKKDLQLPQKRQRMSIVTVSSRKQLGRRYSFPKTASSARWGWSKLLSRRTRRDRKDQGKTWGGRKGRRMLRERMLSDLFCWRETGWESKRGAMEEARGRACAPPSALYVGMTKRKIAFLLDSVWCQGETDGLHMNGQVFIPFSLQFTLSRWPYSGYETCHLVRAISESGIPGETP